MSNIKLYTLEEGVVIEIPFNEITFSGGEQHINVSTYKDLSTCQIVARVQSSSDLMKLFMLHNAVRLKGAETVDLVLPYVPYARQDRACAEGDAFSLKVFGNLLNSVGFDSVCVVDPHSDVTPAVIDNCRVISQMDIISKSDVLTNLLLNTTIISPDAGSNKKMHSLSNYTSKEFIRADKLRDVFTGDIKETVVYCDNLGGNNVTIVDDICDGGRTFIELAKALKHKNCGEVNLFITHGIFSKGVENLYNNYIDKIYTTNSFNEWDVYGSAIVDNPDFTLIRLEELELF
jgi:ribose-phosphate pyrophosphokinase